MMFLQGYEFAQELLRTDWDVIWRGNRLRDGGPVLIRLPRHQPAHPAEADLMEREYHLVRNLNLEGVALPCEFIRHDTQCALVFEDRGEAPLTLFAGPDPIGLEQFFKIAIQLAGIVAELHRQDFTHNGLSPYGVLVHPQTIQVTLSDFRLTTRGACGVQGWPWHSLWRDLLPYISPEQTGRMNRTPDYRTDFYSLGLVLYETLTGVRPCQSQNTLEAIHWHIAQTPPSPQQINPRVPPIVSQIVMKLLSKAPEERYQSALKLKEDLETCAREWRAHGAVASFPLGRRDVWDRLVIPQKLYGREKEVEKLLQVFGQTCSGQSALMVVSGYSGVGKTSLIQELYRSIVRQKGYFLTGKSDQVVRNIPFGALIQAFQGLVHQLLTESEDRLECWRSRLGEALGPNAGVVAEVIPEIELILGEQSPPTPLGPIEAQNRFQLVFQNFVGAMAQRDHPLVVFLDDLQWTDPATLNLLQPLLSGSDIKHLLLIGAYRDNEVDPAHPLIRTIAHLESAGARVERLTLGPLGTDDLTCFIQDTLHGERADAEALARLVQHKTDGNPFFVIQFLKTLQQEGHLWFDYGHAKWAFQLENIERAGITDNVAELMTRKIQKLSPETQNSLMLAACLGNPFDLGTLAAVNEQSLEQATVGLRQAVAEGLVAEIGQTIDTALSKPDADPAVASFAFLHDRVQQAAYALIPGERREFLHLNVGRLLLNRWDSNKAEKKVFGVVGHLNLGRALMSEERERVNLAQLNLAAGRKAKLSTAFQAALGYFETGLSALDDGHWKSQYDLMLNLRLETAECKYICGQYQEADWSLDGILQRAQTRLDKARTYSLRVVQYAHTSRYADAVRAACEGLALFGVTLPSRTEEKDAALDAEIAVIRDLIGERSIESLVDLPVMVDREIRVVMRILTEVWAPAYLLGDPVLTRLVSAMLVRLSLVHGNTEESAYGYVTHAITVGPVKGDYQAAFEFGNLALCVNERFNDVRQRAKVQQQFGAHVNVFKRPLRTCLPHAREACRSGLEAGDFAYANYGAFVESWFAFLTGDDLALYVRDYSPNLALIKRLKVPDFIPAQKVILNWALALQGLTHAKHSLSNEDYDEEAFLAAYGSSPVFMTFYYIPKLHLQLVFEEHDKALEIAQKGRQLGEALAGTIWPPLRDFLCGLAFAANYNQAAPEARVSYLAEISSIVASLEPLTRSCPENFLCLLLMLRAEAERIQDHPLAAMELYEQAIRYARETNSLLNESLATDLYARFWRMRNNQAIAALYTCETARRYEEWGATAKVRDLIQKYPSLLLREVVRSGIPQAITDSAGLSLPVEQEPKFLDVNTVIKAARAIAIEIGLEGLLRALMKIALENAGAQRGFFLEEQGIELFIEAEGEVGQEASVRQSVPLANAQNLAQAVVRYVRKTRESVVIGNATVDERFAGDPYIQYAQPKSILCVPVVHEGKLGGILYLENNLTCDAFTPERIEIMRIISTTAAISLAKARLYEEMKQEVALRRRAEEREHTLLEINNAIISKLTQEELFRAIAQAVRRVIPFDQTAIFLHDPEKNVLRLFFLESSIPAQRFVVGLETGLDESPIGSVLQRQKHLLGRASETKPPHPTKDLLFEEGLRSYMVVPLVSRGKTIGTLSVASCSQDRYADADAGFLEEVASQVALAIANMKAYEEIAALKARLQDENIYLQEEIRREHNFEEMVGSSPALLEVLRQVESVAPTDSTVLVQGETGTGKELIARAIHDRSKRRERPLVKVNCAAIAAGLVESELFGHVKGAFTGAIESSVGRFGVADGGTIFLDEIGELPLETQVKLLRVLQEMEFEPVGSSRSIRVDVRIIAATNRDLQEAVRAGRFRSDLYFRLNVLPLRVPPLRERRTDIPQLVFFFLERYKKKFGKEVHTVSQDTMDLLTNYPWPGNIRELQNVIERGVVLSTGSVLRLGRDFFPDVAQDLGQPSDARQQIPDLHGTRSLTGKIEDMPTLEEAERRHILNALLQTSGVIEGADGAARILDIHPNTLRSRMKKLGIKRPAHERS